MSATFCTEVTSSVLVELALAWADSGRTGAGGAGVQSLNRFVRPTSVISGTWLHETKQSARSLQLQARSRCSPSLCCGVQPNNCCAVRPYNFATTYDVLPAWIARCRFDRKNHARSQ